VCISNYALLFVVLYMYQVIYCHFKFHQVLLYSQTCVKRSPLRQKKVDWYDKWPLKRGFIYIKLSMTG
jgi:hypothetical protein